MSSKTESFFVALATVGMVVLSGVAERENARKFQSATKTLENKLQSLKAAGAHELMGSRYDYNQAERKLMEFKLAPSEEAACDCMRCIQKCEESFNFFS